MSTPKFFRVLYYYIIKQKFYEEILTSTFLIQVLIETFLNIITIKYCLSAYSLSDSSAYKESIKNVTVIKSYYTILTQNLTLVNI